MADCALLRCASDDMLIYDEFCVTMCMIVTVTCCRIGKLVVLLLVVALVALANAGMSSESRLHINTCTCRKNKKDTDTLK